MKRKTLVCSYGKGVEVKRVFEHLYATYLMNGAGVGVYCALIDLPDAYSYRSAGDRQIEEDARDCFLRLRDRCEGEFFCGIRQRRIGYESRRFSCENGVAGAIEALWRWVRGKQDALFPVYGGAAGELDGMFVSAVSDSGPQTVIESGGIYKLWAALNESGAACAYTDGAPVGGGALYSARALDEMLFCETYRISSVRSAATGLTVVDGQRLFKLGQTQR